LLWDVEYPWNWILLVSRFSAQIESQHHEERMTKQQQQHLQDKEQEALPPHWHPMMDMVCPL
jgi:hypothetical protein